MPEISRFFGIVIRMFMEVGEPHHRQHFHAYYQNAIGNLALDPVDLIAGGIPRKQRRLVEAWAELHQDELEDDWSKLQAGRLPKPIQPLR